MARLATGAAQAEVFGTVFFLAQYMARAVDAALEPLGLTTKQWLLLVILLKKVADDEPTLSEAARVYGSSRQNVKQIAMQLEKRGYLHIDKDPKDARVLRLRLLPKVAVFDTAPERARQSALMDEVFSWADTEDVEQLRGLLGRWVSIFLQKP
jgi:DNA-binding MarR family transcriptional regulator